MAEAVGGEVALDEDAVGGLEAGGEGGAWSGVSAVVLWGREGEEVRMSLQEDGMVAGGCEDGGW